MDDLLRELTLQGITCQGYADDIVLIARGRFEETVCDIIQRRLNTTTKWCRSVGLGINPSKTKVVAYTRRKKVARMKQLTLNGVELELGREAKYLGITLDSTLMFKTHIEDLARKAIRALMVCRRMAGKTWGCKPSILYWMYIMIVRPIITYGAIAWYTRTKVISVQSKLSKLQRLACLCITGAMRTCPTASMEKILGLSPIQYEIAEAAVKHC